MMQFPSSMAKRPRLDVGADVSEEHILQLVAQRESFRQGRRFQESDAIREELRSYGVELYDKEKEWRCNDGRRGKLFTAGAQACMMNDEEIQERVGQREEARKEKNFPMADTIRDELRAAGVELDDKTNSWSTGNGRRGTYAGGPAYAAGSIGLPAIRKLVAERERLRATSDFEAADELRRQLLQMGVELFDNERTWRSVDGHRGVIITGGHEVDCHMSETEISFRVQEREQARTGKDWGHADAIRDDLRRQGVELLDNQKLWCTADGRQGTYAPAVPHGMGGGGFNAAIGIARGIIGGGAGGSYGQAPSMARMPSPQMTSGSSGVFSTASIVAMVSGREVARDTKDWMAADAIRTDLRTHGVDVWDKEKVWRANDGRSGPLTKLR